MPLLINNAIAWANLQISGGWSRVVWVTALIAIGLPLMLFGSMRISERPDATLTWWYHALALLQGILFGIVIPSRVHGAIKRDRLTKLIESHRLMPEGAASSILGYILGPNLLLLSAMGCVFVVGAFIAGAAGQDLRGWLALHSAAVGLSLMMCCLVTFTTQWLPKFNPALLGLIFGPMAIGVGSIVPALRVMFSPYTSGLAALQMGEIKVMHVVAFASQLTLAAILFVGACRRYRRDDMPPLGMWWGLALLTLWVALTCIGAMGERVWIVGPFNSDQVTGLSFVIGVASSLLLAIGPVSSAATAIARWRDRRAIDAYFIDREPLPLIAATMLVLALLLTLLLAAPLTVGTLAGFGINSTARQSTHLWLTGIVIVVFVLNISLLAFAAGRMRIPPAYLFVPWLILLWAALPILDGVTAAMQGDLESFPRSLSSASTPFTLGMIWNNDIPKAIVGVVAQVALIPLQLALWAGIKRFNGPSSRIEAAIAV
jgi:hypothetical protein